MARGSWWFYTVLLALFAIGISAQVILNMSSSPHLFMFVISGMMAVGISLLVIVAQREYREQGE